MRLTSAYTKAIDELPKDQQFRFYSIITQIEKAGESTTYVSVTSGTLNTNERGSWVTMFSNNIEPQLQSALGMGFGGSSMQFCFIMTPAGGCYVKDES